ncbi:hypothetical protein BD414DRAFT_425817 [Trametes punicea]|nr:hypothetical protein BD414DRAFT_425817 [Trametes punicea]
MLILSNSAPAAPVDTPDGLPKFPSLDNSYGAVLLGTYFGLILFGLTAHQAWRYFGMYPKDRRALKVLICSVSSRSRSLAETLTSALTVHICYYYLVENYFNPSALRVGTWYVSAVYYYDCFLIGIALSMPVFCLVLKCTKFGSGNSHKARHSSHHLLEHSPDTLLTSVLILVLHESRTGFQRTDSMINRMITYSVNTGESPG